MNPDLELGSVPWSDSSSGELINLGCDHRGFSDAYDKRFRNKPKLVDANSPQAGMWTGMEVINDPSQILYGKRDGLLEAPQVANELWLRWIEMRPIMSRHKPWSDAKQQ